MPDTLIFRNRVPPNHPNFWEGAYCIRGFSYSILAQYQRAIQDFDLAIRLDPHVADVYMNRGFSYYSLRQYQRAIQDYDEAIQLDTQLAEAYVNRGAAWCSAIG